MRRAAAAAAQLNGKDSSDSGKSDSGEETRSNEDTKDFDSTSEKTGTTKPDAVHLDEDTPVRVERRDWRRNDDFGNRRGGGSWRYHDKNNDNPKRGNDNPKFQRHNWGYAGDRGYRGRGSYRGRRGGYRDNRFQNNVSNARTVSNGQATVER